MTKVEERINEMFEELVPISGKAGTVAGEIIRAVCRIGYRCWNDGDHVGVGYGRETCNPTARFLGKTCGGEVADWLTAMWGVESDAVYDKLLGMLEEAVVKYIEDHPDTMIAENVVDMWDFRDPYEDVDNEEDEEDEDWGA